MLHPRVAQLYFTRAEWLRALSDVPAEDALRRLGPMNSIGWIAGHLAWQENRYWLAHAQGASLAPRLDALVGYGAPASTPPLAEMLATWRQVTEAAGPFLESLTTADLQAPMRIDGRPQPHSTGSRLQRMTYHYWFHIGEILAIRQMLGHRSLPEYVGPVEAEAPYTPESPLPVSD